MEKLKRYLSALSVTEKTDFEHELHRKIGKKVTINHIRSRISRNSYLNPKLCMAIEVVTNGTVKRQDLRPDWREIWIELAEKETATHSGSPKSD
ncbi:YdaS family helix-turn-helix protein [Wielerella bovis]|uniref:YdaS family helix-turn-helix protein n=1 Tax=Wielerella bovis TaxID=2917790 RepID=UPI0020195726|nr:YdaS family helix-turn-helix protein [Wielerella bovis]ULJ66195.1 helix-turn-helix domain-containing protein [Wielerella bovis]